MVCQYFVLPAMLIGALSGVRVNKSTVVFSRVLSNRPFSFCSYQFKATEFNPKIVEMQGMYGVKQVPEASTTQVKPFHFELDSRTDHRKQKEEVNKPAEVSRLK